LNLYRSKKFEIEAYKKHCNQTGGIDFKLPVATIKAIGISQKNAGYIHHFAQFIHDHKITDKKLEKMPDEDVIDTLIKIKGVGRWTVDISLSI